MSQQTQRQPNDHQGVTRRRLLAVGGSAAVAASLPGFLHPKGASAAAGWLNRSTYTGRIGDLFVMRLESGARLNMRLEAVTGNRRSFDLLFKPATTVEHPQATRRVAHKTLGQTEFFVVPLRTPNAALRYVVSVNRARS